MPYSKFSLPKYPCTSDMWTDLRKETRPIVIYGMGNGADKLIERFENIGIKYADIFASDGFLRGHSFHGIRVKSLEEIRTLYEDFVIVLSFASNREEVLYMLSELNMRFDMYVPDMPVAGVDEYFDMDFYNANYEKIVCAYDLFFDEDSKNAFAAIINFKLSGRMSYLMEAYSERDELYSLFPKNDIRTVVDAGAYNGDTAREAKHYFPSLERIYAIEPDKRNYKKLLKYSEDENDVEVIPINAAVWSESSRGEFFGSGNRNSTVVATSSYEHVVTEVSLVSVDDITDGKVDYVKYDVEGAECEALLGSKKLVLRDKPSLLVSLYHRSRDIFALPLMLSEWCGEYKFYLRRLKCLPAWEIDLIMIPT